MFFTLGYYIFFIVFLAQRIQEESCVFFEKNIHQNMGSIKDACSMALPFLSVFPCSGVFLYFLH